MRTMSIMGAVLLMAWSAALAGDDLSFERRIEAQRAIERVYYSHQIGATEPFEQAVPRELLEKKVRTYLTQSVALEEFWETPVTAEALRHELERVAANTRFPGRLQEIYAALGHDPILIQETFVRQVLVDRLARSFFSTDQRIHGAARREADALRAALLRGEIDPLHERDGRSETRIGIANGGNDNRRGQLQDPERIELPHGEFERRRHLFPARVGDTGPVQEEPGVFVVRVLLEEHADGLSVATYSVAKTTWDDWWSGVSAGYDVREARTLALDVELTSPQNTERLSPGDTDGRLEPCADEFWDNGGLDDVPDGRREHTAVWTGSLMVVWGGYQGTSNFYFNTGGRYDPLTDTWSATSVDGAPSPRHEHTAIWTGSEMIVWGGRHGSHSFTNTGGRYDPLSNTWTPTSTTGAASSRTLHTAVWTGSEMIVWGGWDFNFNQANSGGRYDPAADTWIPTSTIDAPIERYLHTAVWAGNEMIIWGGADDFEATYDTGGRYDPSTDTWAATSLDNVPENRSDHTAVWTGSEMIVWGGDDTIMSIGTDRNTGGRYDPNTDTWTATSMSGVPSARFYHTAIWTGSQMIIWGGGAANNGGRYDPNTNTWTSTSLISAPTARSWHTAVWTGDLMVVWGGSSSNLNTGGRYDPVADSWTPTSTSGAPIGRSSHTAIWTGSKMIVWGGSNLNTGGRYDPLTDAWSATSTFDAPSGRSNHTAVWTGSQMIVWGGENSLGRLNSGGRYNPIADTWIGTITIGAAPSQRSGHSAIWTGSRMLIWGGRNGSTFMNSGSSYDPAGNTWELMSLTGVPSARAQHTAVWTGSRLLVWGGLSGPSLLDTGGRYDPNSNSWSSMSTTGAPSARMGHTAVWTGDKMVIWGAGSDSSGGRYDPSDDSWLSTSLADAPSPRSSHTAVWTGSRMLIWGGSDGPPLNTGGSYDPVADFWTPISLEGAPSARGGHSAVWTGNHMIVWSGNGGRYHPADGDGDGMTICGGDCDDAGGSIYDGAPDLCDGLNNDCGHPSWPALAGTVDMDDDGDALSECSGDCDDTDVTAWAVPGTVPGLTFIDQSTMTWNPPAPPGGTAPLYDTLRAALPDGFSSSLMCVEEADAGTTSTDPDIPSPGEVAYYLVRAQNGCGTGGVGATSDDTPRAATSCP